MKLVLSILSITLFVGCVTTMGFTPKPENAKYEYIDTHAKTKDEAFNSLELALANTYKSYKTILDLSNKETGTIIVKPICIAYYMGCEKPVHYTLSITVKDNKVRYVFETGRSTTDVYYPYDSTLKTLIDEYASVRKQLNDALSKQNQEF